MNKLLVAVFTDEKKAYEGVKALKDLHAEGSITLYASAVIAKDTNGKVGLKQTNDPGPINTVLGFLTGSLIGLFAGPAGVVAGGATGVIAGSMYDLAEVGLTRDFFDEVSKKLSPGKSAIVADIDEEWVTPLDARMEALHGEVFRRARAEFIDAQIDRQIAADNAEFDQLKTEYNQATGAAKAKLKVKVDAVHNRLVASRAQLHKKIETMTRESDARIKALQEQAAKSTGETKVNLERRIAESRAEYKVSADKLRQAAELIKEAA